jgi:hypothetical protein
MKWWSFVWSLMSVAGAHCGVQYAVGQTAVSQEMSGSFERVDGEALCEVCFLPVTVTPGCQGNAKFTADDMLPSLMAAIVRCPVDHLCAHFSFIQFHNDGSAELQYHLTTVRAALQYIRRAGNNQPPLQALAEVSASVLHCRAV